MSSNPEDPPIPPQKPGATHRSVIEEVSHTQLAIEMIGFGARLQVLEAETHLSRDRLNRLYREIRAVSPSKGMLPYSADWFTTWMPNIHATMFYSAYAFLTRECGVPRSNAIVKAYRFYMSDIGGNRSELVLSFTRAWTLVKFFECGMLELTACRHCHGRFVAHAHTNARGFTCGLCRPPARAGKTRPASGAEARALFEREPDQDAI